MMRKSAICFCLLVFGLLCSAAAKDIPLIADPSVPAAGGRVSVNKHNNGNVRIKLQVEHMAKPGALTPARQNYVVWMQARAQEPQNQGMPRVDDKLKGTFETTMPNQYFEVFVTAEDNPAAQTPSGPKLLHAEVQP